MAWLETVLQLLLAFWNWWTSPTRSRSADTADIRRIPEAVDEAFKDAKRRQETREAK